MPFSGRFLGAAEDIGRLGFVLEGHGHRFLFDYGMAPEKPPLYPLEAPPIDRVFLTHAHLDHSGMVPWLAARYDAPIHTTSVTADVAHLMHKDSLKIARSEGFPEPYNDADIEATQGLWDRLEFGAQTQLGPFTAALQSAGHIPGAAQVLLDDGSTRMVFTGDLFTRPQRVVGPAKQTRCDVLFMEATYAGREHPPRDEVERDFVEFCLDVTERGGITLAPAFAVGRSQELCMVLAETGLRVWIDGMGRAVDDIFRTHPRFLADEDAYRKALGAVRKVTNHRNRSYALQEADVIVTTGGMLDGGPVLWYLDNIRNDPKSAVAVSGFQVAGTNGRKLLDGQALDFDLRDPGKSVHKVRCEVRRFDFSAHAGHSDLVAFAKATGCDEVVLFHGDQREELVGDLSDFAEVKLPLRGEHFSVG